MSDTIHLETEATNRMIQSMRAAADRMYDSALSAYRQVALAEWRSSSRDELLEELYSCIRKIHQFCDQLDELAFITTRKTDEWVENAAQFVHQ